MKKSILLSSLGAAVLLASGCSMQVGEDEFACPNSGKGATCSSSRQIYELTNNRDNLEGLNVSMGKIQGRVDANGEVIPFDDGTYNSTTTSKTQTGSAPAFPQDTSYDPDSLNPVPVRQEVQSTAANADLTDLGRARNDVYKPVNLLRQDELPAAELVAEPKNRTFGAVQGVQDEHGKLMVRRQSPMALAPEPLAVLQQPKTMRILISSWTDKDGDLHMPGFVYVEVEPKKWVVGEQANDRPGRIVPLQIQQTSQEELRRQEKAKSGYSSLGVTEKGIR
ncbi:TraV family lipoprotein [Shewanella algae]|uniref:TraV family lipoprotein n=1 Tax=Shewanella algae TaxID=38313 RepID=UPI003AAB7632